MVCDESSFKNIDAEIFMRPVAYVCVNLVTIYLFIFFRSRSLLMDLSKPNDLALNNQNECNLRIQIAKLQSNLFNYYLICIVDLLNVSLDVATKIFLESLFLILTSPVQECAK